VSAAGAQPTDERQKDRLTQCLGLSKRVTSDPVRRSPAAGGV